MILKQFSFGVLSIFLISCNSTEDKTIINPTTETKKTYSDIQVAGAMKNVMWKGELDGVINLDTIQNRKGLYGLGPVSFLTGELLINDGKSYVSRVLTDSTMSVKETDKVAAPFFVYGNVNEWKEVELPENVHDSKTLETFIDNNTKDAKRPFAFKLNGDVETASIHIQSLPEGSVVSSPEEAHQGQTSYPISNEEAEIIGFFSTEHQGIFTHHDSFLHMHLITTDAKKMGHLDEVEFKNMKLFLPVN